MDSPYTFSPDTALDNIAPGYGIAVFDGKEELYRRASAGKQYEREWGQKALLDFYGAKWQVKVWPTRGLLTAKHSFLPNVVLASGVLMAVLLTAVGHLAYTAWARARQVASANQELQCDGYQVETAANGRMALEKLRERPYDLLLSDLRMPELDGMGLYEELAQHYPHLLSRLIFLTGDTLNAETMRLLEQVGAPRLSKPFTATEVRRVVQQALQAL